MLVRKGQITHIHGSTTHLTDAGDQTFDVAVVEIHARDEMFFILRFNSDGECIADTVQFSLADAIAQVEYEYDITWQS